MVEKMHREDKTEARFTPFSEKKVVIIGGEAVGKTSIVLTSCFGYSFDDIENMAPTKGVCIDHLVFRGILSINIWDCAGQKRYLQLHFSDEGKWKVFSDIDAAVFVMDASRVETLDGDYVNQFLEAVLQYNPNMERVYLFINKMDIATKNLNHYQMKMVGKILDKWRGFVQIINCSVKSGTARIQFISVLDSIILSDEKMLERRKVFEKCLSNLKKSVRENIDLTLFHNPSGLVIASTHSHELGLMEHHQFIIDDVMKLEKNRDNAFVDTLIYNVNERIIIVSRINRNTFLLTMQRSLVLSEKPEKVAMDLKYHLFFKDLEKMLVN